MNYKIKFDFKQDFSVAQKSTGTLSTAASSTLKTDKTPPTAITTEKPEIMEPPNPSYFKQDQIQGLDSLCALIENRAQEVGVAILTPELNLITLSQLTDTPAYSQTLQLLNRLEVRKLIFS